MCHSRRYDRPVERASTEDSLRNEPGLRASDQEREAVATLLRRHGGEGRLDLDELEERLDAAYSARTRGDLSRLLVDLPRTPARSRPTPAPVPTRHAVAHAWSAFFKVNALLIAIWALGGFGYFWPAWVMLWWGFVLVMKTGPRVLRTERRVQAGS
jgi:Domain of unknown function (DUF1707)